jgi:hypothetical protein
MKKSVITVTVVVLSVLATLWSGCDNNNDPNTEEFIIQIDSVVHVDTINFGEILSINFYGEVGPDKCYAFKELVPEYIIISDTEGELTVTSFGLHTFKDICLTGEVYMNGSELAVSDIPAGNLVINAIQPDGTSISQNVFIKE